MIELRCRTIGVLLLVLFSSGVWSAYGQGQDLTGAIQDAETNEPLAGVHVFLASRLQGTTTDSNGRFIIENVQPGSYKVVASIIGFASASVVVEILPDQAPGTIALRLKPAIYEMEGVVVEETRSREWQRRLDRFKDLFLGTSSNAKDSEILNEYALSFRLEDGTFEAFAREPLEIDNHGLGYHLTFVLDQFKHDKEKGLKYTFGTWRFEEMEPENEKEARQWERQRELVFKGSLQHLLWSMINLQTDQEGFHLLRDSSKYAVHPETFLTNYYPLNEHTILRKSDRPYEYKMTFPDFIRIYYERTGDRIRLFGSKAPPAEQLSYMKMNRQAEATVHESGYLYAPAGTSSAVTVFGYLASRGVADLLPQEYALQRNAE